MALNLLLQFPVVFLSFVEYSTEITADHHQKVYHWFGRRNSF